MRTPSAVALLVALCACEPEAPRIEKFEASPPLLSAGGGEVTLRWDVPGAESVEISPSVGRVEPAGERTVAIDETTRFMLIAFPDPGLHTASLQVEVERHAITGRVLDWYGNVVPDATITVDGESVTTDPFGRFATGAVRLPYRLRATTSSRTDIIADGLQAQELAIQVPPASGSREPIENRRSSVSGTVRPVAGGPEIDPYTTQVLTLVRGEEELGWGGELGSGSGRYSIGFRWRGPESVPADIIAYQGDRSGPYGISSQLTAFARRRVTAVEGKETQVDLPLQRVSTFPRRLEFVTPGAVYGGAARSLRFPSLGVIWLTVVPGGRTYDLPVPWIEGAEIAVSTSLQRDNADKTIATFEFSRRADGEWPNPLVIAAPDEPRLRSPHDGGRTARAGTLSWSRGGYDACRLSIQHVEGPGVVLVTAAESIALDQLDPDRTWIGPGGEYRWWLECWKPATVEGLLAQLSKPTYPPPSSERWTESSGTWSFAVDR